jgi:GNAT superfamily N-acetyltransferase
VIRDYREGDAAGIAAFLREHRPPKLYVMTAAGIEYRIGHLPEQAGQRVWVAEEDGSVVGWARARLRWTSSEPGIGRVEVEVARPSRRRGLGGDLLALAEEHLRARGAWKIDCAVLADEAGLGFARAHGYAETRRETYSWVEPRPVEIRAAAGVRLVPLHALAGRLHDAWRLEAEAIADVPADVPLTQIDFDEWVDETLDHPDLDHDGSFYALADDRLAAYTLVSVDRERGLAWNEMTGTAPAFRRRGLARLVKLASIRWAAEAGIRSFSTSNDSENAAMLALNRELGYRPLVDGIELAKRV